MTTEMESQKVTGKRRRRRWYSSHRLDFLRSKLFWLAVVGLLALVAFFMLGFRDRTTAVVAQQQAQETQETLDQVADPLAALCASDPSVRARVGPACETATEAAAAPVAAKDGIDGRGITSTRIDEAGTLIISYTDGTDVPVGRVVGLPGVDGTGITGASIANGRLVLSFSDGHTQDVGAVVGPQGTAGVAGANGLNGVDGANGLNGADGAPGRGIASTDIVDGRLIITYDDGATQDAGPVPAGPPGADGSPAGSMLLQGAGAVGGDLTCTRNGGPDTSPVYACS